MSSLKVKGSRGSRQIKIGNGEWWPIDSRAELDNVPFEIHTIALYSNGTHGDVRLQVLRELCRERGWTVTGGFSDESIAVAISSRMPQERNLTQSTNQTHRLNKR